MLFRLTYALKLRYPPNLRYTFEVIQNILMELDGVRPAGKIVALKNRLFQ